MEAKFAELKQRLGEVEDLRMAAYVLGWDQMTYMPPGGAEGRGRQVSTLLRLAQEKSSDAGLGRLLDDLATWAEQMPYDSIEASLVRVARRDFERENKLPPEFVQRYYAQGAESINAWTTARPENDFARVLPHLEKRLELSREWANYYPGYAHIADPLIEVVDPGMRTSAIRSLFAELRAGLAPLARAVAERPQIDDSPLQRGFDRDGQLAFTVQVAERIGYDFQRGRQDLTYHPFTTSFGVNDVRITTRVREYDLGEALFSSIHEAGHAMYEQGIDPALDGLPLARGASSGVHESQSRLWENLVGRSRGFWEFFYPRLQQTFPGQLEGTPLEAFYRAANRVAPGLIRTDADELTYNLHVMIRFDLELEMLEGRLAVKDLPEAWRARYSSDLGVTPPDDKDGCMQDAHWFDGTIGGMFQGYTLGNILSAQFYQQALLAHPEITGQISRGDFSTLLGWLRENIYRHGRKFSMPELVQRVTGGPLDIQPYLQYLTGKYTELYGL